MIKSVVRSERVLDAAVGTVFAVLADGYLYPDWVVGAALVRSVDGSWPAASSRLHHVVGFGPLRVEGDTEVLELDRCRRLVLEARVRPFGAARVELDLVPAGTRTLVCMKETLVAPYALRWLNIVGAPFVKVRNAHSLRRLERLVRA